MCLGRGAASLLILPPHLTTVRTCSCARARTPLSRISELLQLMGLRCRREKEVKFVLLAILGNAVYTFFRVCTLIRQYGTPGLQCSQLPSSIPEPSGGGGSVSTPRDAVYHHSPLSG